MFFYARKEREIEESIEAQKQVCREKMALARKEGERTKRLVAEISERLRVKKLNHEQLFNLN